MVVVKDDGRIVASAKGIPPDWIVDIPGTEAWAILQGTNITMPGSPYRVDCKPCIDAIHKGIRWATASCRPLARVFNLIFPAIDDSPVESFVWMPAHTSASDVGVKRLGNGDLLTALDRSANDRADVLAKEGAATERVSAEIRKMLTDHHQMVSGTARWIGYGTHDANPGSYTHLTLPTNVLLLMYVVVVISNIIL